MKNLLKKVLKPIDGLCNTIEHIKITPQKRKPAKRKNAKERK